MAFAIKFLGEKLKTIQKQGHGDWVDYLNHYYAVLILVVFASIVGAKQIVGTPIQCWTPAEFKNDWIEYARTYCFIAQTYYIPFNTSLSNIGKSSIGQPHISYYQWVPWVLLFQALLFYMPHVGWKFLSGLTGIDVRSMLKMAEQTAGLDSEKRPGNIRIIAHTLMHSLRVRRAMGKRPTCWSIFWSFFGMDRLRGPGNQLCCIYIFMKVLNCVNVIGQFFFVDAFLGANEWFLGGRILSDFFQGKDWSESGRFPRVTMCDFSVRVLNQVHNYTIQCVLSINMWNEKIFLLLWVWFIFVAVCTCWNLFGWIYACFRSTSKLRLAEKYLKAGLPPGSYELDSVSDGHLFEKFMRNGLNSDGILLIRFISGHVGDLIATEVMTLMFEDFVKTCKQDPLNMSMIKPPPLERDQSRKSAKISQNGVLYHMGSGPSRERYDEMVA